jgi:hypothetical protein
LGWHDWQLFAILTNPSLRATPSITQNTFSSTQLPAALHKITVPGLVLSMLHSVPEGGSE